MNHDTAVIFTTLLIFMTGISILPFTTIFLFRFIRHFLSFPFRSGRTLIESLDLNSQFSLWDGLAIMVGHVWPLLLSVWLLDQVAPGR